MVAHEMTKEKDFHLFYKYNSLDLKVNTEDELWDFPEEPHSERRQEILKKHPEIKQLMGYDPFIAYVVAGEVILQVFMAWLLMDADWVSIFILAYCVGGTLNHSLGSAIHEIGHNLAFGHRRASWNRWLGIWCNVPLIIPMSVTYRKYHADHHRFMGEEYNDVDVPSRIESILFRNPVTKIIWLILYPLLQAIRPYFKNPKPVNSWEIINLVVQMMINVLWIKTFGIKSVVYLLSGTLLGMGLHPLAGHFISEHYLYTGRQATHSYYGPLNIIMFNVGYHNEHHDFPYIPYHRLPKVKQIASEYYDLPCHTSWIKVLWDFIFKDHLGPHAHGVGFLKSDTKDFKGVWSKHD